MKKLLFGLLGLLVTISGWSAETNSGPISSVTVAGLVAQNGTPTPTTPIDILSNNGVLKVSKNLFNENDVILGYFYEDNGTYVSNANTFTSGKIPMNAGTTVTFSRSLSVNNVYLRIHAFNSNNEWIGLVAKSASASGLSATGTTPANTSYIMVCGAKRIDSTEIDHECQVELGSTATTYRPYGQIYTDGEVETIGDSANHTATVATLLGVGDYRDTQNINTGAITRNVGVKVLDGTENIGKSGTYSGSFFVRNVVSDWGTSNNAQVYCSHFSGVTAESSYAQNKCMVLNNAFNMWWASDSTPTLAQFQQWLADQYAAGTPVIVVYPLAEPTTESVAGQTMTTAPVNNRTGGVTGMTITTLLSSGASVVTTIAANAIKIATTAYNSARFSPVVTELNDTIATIRSVVTNTINQTKAIADLQATKQTRPDEQCPAGKKCLLVEDADGQPHWYEIIESASRLPDGYIERQYIYMMEGSYLLTDIVPTFAGHYELDMQTTSVTGAAVTYLGGRDESSGNGGLRFAHISDKTFRVLAFGNAITLSGTAANNTKYKFIWDNGSFWIYSGTTLIHSKTFTEETMPTTTPLAINGWNSGGTIGGNIEGIYLYGFKAWNNQGQLIADYVPAVQEGTVPVVGFYDTVSGTFKTATAGTFTAGPEI